MLKNRIVCITGASSGIGAACARQFAANQAKLILCARRGRLVQRLAAELSDKYAVEIQTLVVDVQDNVAVTAAIESLAPEWQAIDILVNNAGLAAGLDTIQEGNLDDWEAMINTNIKGVLYVTKAILPQMIKRNSGYIFNIGSVAGHTVYPKGAVYCATKFAVNALSQGLRMDLMGTKIRVSTIDPGMVQTNFSLVRLKGDDKKAEQVYHGMAPLTADDIAETIVFCATRPLHVNIAEVIIMPTDQAAATLVARHSE